VPAQRAALLKGSRPDHDPAGFSAMAKTLAKPSEKGPKSLANPCFKRAAQL
jgi:hypothetical protein